MAFKECKECGYKVSKKAEACPKCGAVQKKKLSGCTGCLIIIILSIIFFCAIGSKIMTDSESTVNSTKQERKIKTKTKPKPKSKPKPKTKKEIRDKQIKNQFSVWDGSHNGLTRIIKKSMNDPSSYKHVETVYWDKGSYLLVRTTFRGKNAFGGIVKNFFKAKVDLNGNVLQIIEQGK